MRVIVWTVNDVPTMQSLIDIGVVGIITDHPDRLRALMAGNVFKLPKAYAAR
jgi:glycerophosphoryl diester phosphodiesterase